VKKENLDGLGHCLPANFDHVNPKNTFDDADAEEIPKPKPCYIFWQSVCITTEIKFLK
jgi:hypothetical protein